VFLACWGLRKLVTAGLLLTPWVAARSSPDGAFLYVLGLMVLFALLRAVAETAWVPWAQEIVPAAVRGRVHGINNVVGLLCNSTALLCASWILGRGTGLDRFLYLIAAGVGFGVLCVLFGAAVPGGGRGHLRETAHWPAVRAALGDARFRLYLSYTALTLVTMQAFASFVPLFMKEQIGLPGSRIVLLDVAAAIVGVLSSYGWGVWSDRAGSRPLSTIVGLMACLPLLWVLLPRHDDLSFTVAVAVACLAGGVFTGWWVSDHRLFYVEIVPPERRTEYTAIYYAWIGLVGGCGPLLAGPALDAAHGLRFDLGPIHGDGYTPFFATSALLLLVGRWLLQRLRRRTRTGGPTIDE
jgi:predicted MFS family arabinose efflux permease